MGVGVPVTPPHGAFCEWGNRLPLTGCSQCRTLRGVFEPFWRVSFVLQGGLDLWQDLD